MLSQMSGSLKSEAVLVIQPDTEPSEQTRLRDLAQQFNVPVTDSPPWDQPYLHVQNDCLALRDPAMTGASSVVIDLVDAMTKAKRGGRRRDHPLVRAVGRDSARIIDATAGFGGDTGLLLGFGYEVLAIERVGALAAILTDALRRGEHQVDSDPPLHKRLAIRHGDAREVLHTLQKSFDAVLIDPMFPPKRKSSALAKKEIRMVRTVAGDDPDADELLEAARSSAIRRVVVKRPTHAPPLAPAPSLQYKSKLVRYDVYIRALEK